MEFTCTACGRIAKEKSHLCNPRPLQPREIPASSFLR
jgi:hypothetical protein